MALEPDNNLDSAIAEIEHLEDLLLRLISENKRNESLAFSSVKSFDEAEISRNQKGLLLTLDSGKVYKISIDEY